MGERTKCASSLKNLKFIMPRRVEDSSKRKFIKKGKDLSSTERCKCIEARKKSRKCMGKRSPKVHSIKRLKTQKRKEAHQAENPKGRSRQKLEPKKKKKKPTRLKTQKGNLGKSQGPKKKKPTKLKTQKDSLEIGRASCRERV